MLGPSKVGEPSRLRHPREASASPWDGACTRPAYRNSLAPGSTIVVLCSFATSDSRYTAGDDLERLLRLSARQWLPPLCPPPRHQPVLGLAQTYRSPPGPHPQSLLRAASQEYSKMLAQRVQVLPRLASPLRAPLAPAQVRTQRPHQPLARFCPHCCWPLELQATHWAVQPQWEQPELIRQEAAAEILAPLWAGNPSRVSPELPRRLPFLLPKRTPLHHPALLAILHVRPGAVGAQLVLFRSEKVPELHSATWHSVARRARAACRLRCPSVAA